MGRPRLQCSRCSDGGAFTGDRPWQYKRRLPAQLFPSLLSSRLAVLAFYSIFSRALSPGFNFHKKTRPLPERRTLKRALKMWGGFVGCFSRCFFLPSKSKRGERCPKNQISARCAVCRLSRDDMTHGPSSPSFCHHVAFVASFPLLSLRTPPTISSTKKSPMPDADSCPRPRPPSKVEGGSVSSIRSMSLQPTRPQSRPRRRRSVP